jgi:hypothetical protein
MSRSSRMALALAVLLASLPGAASGQAPEPLGLRPPGAMDCAVMPSRIIDVATPMAGVLEEVLVRAKGEIRAPAGGIIGEELSQAGEAANGRPLIIVEPELDYISPLADQSSRTIRAYHTLTSDRVAPGDRYLLLSPEAAAAALSGL